MKPFSPVLVNDLAQVPCKLENSLFPLVPPYTAELGQ